MLLKKAVCMHEEDAGILWKHSEYRTGYAEVRRWALGWQQQFCGSSACEAACLPAISVSLTACTFCPHNSGLAAWC